MPSLFIALESSITLREQLEKQMNIIFGTVP